MIKKTITTALVGMFALLLIACPSAATKGGDSAEENPLRTLEVAESASFDFPADGLWHPTPFQVLNGQQLIIRPIGAATGFSSQAIQFKIGRLAQLVHPTRPFRVTQPGRVEVRLAPEYLQEDKGLITVQVERLE